MRKPWLIVPQAFVDGPERNLLQLAASLPTPVDNLRYELEGLGVDISTPSQLFTLAEHRGSACYLYHGHKLVQFQQPAQRRTDHPRSIVASVFSGRLYLYANAASFAAEDAKRHPGARVGVEVVEARGSLTQPQKGERHDPTKDIDAFEPYPWHLEVGDVPSGCYWVEARCAHGGM